MTLTNEDYLKYEKMIDKQVFSFYRKNSKIEIEELKAQANLIYVEAANSYDPNKSKFSAYLWNSLEMNLQNYFRNNKTVFLSDHLIPHPIEIDDRIITKDIHDIFIELEEWIGTLTARSKEIIKAAFEMPDDMLKHSPTKNKACHGKINKSLLSKYFTQEQNWSQHNVNICFKEIKNRFKEFIGVVT